MTKRTISLLSAAVFSLGIAIVACAPKASSSTDTPAANTTPTPQTGLSPIPASGGFMSGTQPRTGPGHVHVMLVKGPLKLLGPGKQQPTAPIKGAQIDIIDTLNHKTVVSGSTDANGQVAFTVDPGSYKIHVITCPGADGLPPLIPTTVRPGGSSGVMIGCSSKPAPASSK